MGLRIHIIEDEPLAADKLTRQLLQIDDSHEILAVTPSVAESVRFLKQTSPDLILADIQLSDGISLEIFRLVSCDAPIIFVTAYDEYAIQAFQANGIAYLLKPVSKASLVQALNKYNRLGRVIVTDEASAVEGPNTGAAGLDLSTLLSQLKSGSAFKSRFLVQSGSGKLKSLQSDEIAYFFADGKHTFLVARDGHKFFSDSNISELSQILNPEFFFQVNRKYIIHIDSIEEMLPYSKSRVKLQLRPTTQDDVVVSVERSPHFKTWLGK